MGLFSKPEVVIAEKESSSTKGVSAAAGGELAEKAAGENEKIAKEIAVVKAVLSVRIIFCLS